MNDQAVPGSDGWHSAADLSVIICTWNKSRQLATTLDAMIRCAIPANVKWELVLVDNNCTDGTRAVAEEFADRLPLVYVEEPRQGLSRARNRGLRAASGRLIVFTDDDVKPCREWLLAHWDAYEERPSGFYFGGPIMSEWEGGRPEEAALRAAPPSVSGFDFGPRAGVLPPDEQFFGANWACPADALRRSGGFDVHLGLDASLGWRRVGEELDLMDRLRRAGMSPWYLPRARVVHVVPEAKCGIAHIAASVEAQGVYAARSTAGIRFLRRRPDLRPWCGGRGLSVAGVPLRLGLKTVSLALAWALARMRGGKGYKQYLVLRFCMGVLRGHRQRMRGSS